MITIILKCIFNNVRYILQGLQNEKLFMPTQSHVCFSRKFQRLAPSNNNWLINDAPMLEMQFQIRRKWSTDI